MHIHCKSKAKLIDTKFFWNNGQIGTENLKVDVIKKSVDSFLKMSLMIMKNLKNHICKSFCENIKYVDANY